MRKKILVITILFLSFCLAGFSFAQKDLEIEYPQIPGAEAPETITTTLSEYVKYIFNFSLVMLGLVAFGVLVWAGIRYLTSAGSPGIKKDAKNQILAALLGIAILLGSYLILTTINPDLIILETKEPEKIEDVPLPSPTAPVSPDPLVRIKELAENIKNKIAPNLKKEAEDLKPLVEKCDCKNSFSECDCIGWSCSTIRSYGDPCPNREDIVEQQSEIVLAADEILYYKNRVDSEREDIGAELEQFIYWERLTEAQANNLEKYLEDLIEPMEKMASSSKELAELPNQCLKPDKCNPHCGGGCHDGCKRTIACHPEECCGGNPCPMQEIEDKIKEIEKFYKEIIKICQNIINLLN